MLRITVESEPKIVILKLEGKITGPWIDELKKVWHSLLIAPGSKNVFIDLRGITHLSPEGKQVLCDMHKQTGAEFIANSPMTKHFADEARRKNSKAN